MPDATLTISEALMSKLNAYAKAAGQPNGDEIARMILQREIDRLEDSGADQKIEDRLRGLGYIS